MNIIEAIEFLEKDLDIDSDRSSFKEYSEQTDKVREVVKLLERIKKVVILL